MEKQINQIVWTCIMNGESRKDLYDDVHEANSKSVDTKRSVYGGKVDQDQVIHSVDEASYITKDMTSRSVTHHSVKACSFGHVLQGQKTTIEGRCEVCQRFTCSIQGCHFVCSLCSRSLCRSHATIHAGEAYCSGCNWTYWFKKFWGLD